MSRIQYRVQGCEPGTLSGSKAAATLRERLAVVIIARLAGGVNGQAMCDAGGIQEEYPILNVQLPTREVRSQES